MKASSIHKKESLHDPQVRKKALEGRMEYFQSAQKEIQLSRKEFGWTEDLQSSSDFIEENKKATEEELRYVNQALQDKCAAE